MDLSKAFTCIEHELLIAKLNAYGLSKKARLLIYNYVSEREQGVKLNDSFSNWRETYVGVAQGSILGSLLFTVCLNHLVFVVTDTAICNFCR